MSISSEITRINTNIANSYTAVNNKGGTLPQIQNSANLATAINSISGGVDIHGVIEEYKVYAGDNISAGDFVKFIKGMGNEGDETAISTDNNYVGKVISAVALSNNKVFIAHSYGSNYYLYGVVVTVSGTTITVGTDTAIFNSNYYGSKIQTIVLNENKVFIAYRYYASSSNYRLHGIVCEISGTTITKGSDTSISTNTISGDKISAVALSENKVFIAYRYYASSSNYRLHGIVCEINGTTITKGSDTSISNSAYTGYEISAVALSNNKVFIAHSYGGTYYLYGVVCEINGTTITVGTDISINNSSSSGEVISAILIDENKVFIAHSYGSSYYLYGVVCEISGTTITVGTDTQLSSTANTGNVISAILLSENRVFIAHNYDNNNYYLYEIVVTISGTTITAGTDTAVNNGTTNTGYAISAVMLGNEIFIAHSYGSNYYLYGIPILLESYVASFTQDSSIFGVATESGVAGDTIDVVSPRINLFNKDTATLDYRLAPQGQEYEDSNCFVSDWIEIKPNTTYIKNIPADVYQCVCFFEEDKTFISRDKDNTTFTSPSNAKYLRMTGYKTDLNTATLYQK